jgi:hypothetical protein
MIVGTAVTPTARISMGAPIGVKLPIVFSIQPSMCLPVTESMIELRVREMAANPAEKA